MDVEVYVDDEHVRGIHKVVGISLRMTADGAELVIAREAPHETQTHTLVPGMGFEVVS